MLYKNKHERARFYGNPKRTNAILDQITMSHIHASLQGYWHSALMYIHLPALNHNLELQLKRKYQGYVPNYDITKL